MAKEKVEIVLCDICRQQKGDIRTFRITESGGTSVSVDLCGSDAAPIRKILGKGATRSRRGRPRPVVSDADVIADRTS